MSIANPSLCRWLIVSVALLTLAAFARPIDGQSAGQSAPAVRVGGVEIRGVPDDWTHHHVVFSDPSTEQDAIKKGRHEQWQKIVNDPRYVIQQLKRKLPVQGPAAAGVNARRAWLSEARGADRRLPPIPPRRERLTPRPHIEQDWNETFVYGDTASAANQVAYPAKWSFDTTTANCSDDFVIYPTGQTGTSQQATIVAYYNLYDGCSGSGNVPSVDWAYNTGGEILLSPVFSAGGNEVAFSEIVNPLSTPQSNLVVLKFTAPDGGGANGTVGFPDTPTLVSAGDFAGCTAPCMVRVPLYYADKPYFVANDWSNPYYDYGTDSLYVGDGAGQLHKFSPVFNGVPAEVVGDGTNWPIQLANGSGPDTNQVASPVYDQTSGFVLVGTTNGNDNGGYLYSVNASSGAINAYSVRLDSYFGIYDAVLLDPVTDVATVFVGSDPSTSSNLVDQFPATFAYALEGRAPADSFTVGPGDISDAAYQFAGTFDNAYYTSPTGTGNIYMCTSGLPATLYQLATTGGYIQTGTAGPAIGDDGSLSGAEGGYCSPVTEFFNPSLGSGGEDLVFLSVFAGTESGCVDDPTDGCVMSFDITPATLPKDLTSLTPLGTLDVYDLDDWAPTGGIIIDNSATNLSGGGESQIYFQTQDPAATACTQGSFNDGACAVQASQSAVAP